MGLLERCEELFKTSNLYEVLGINKDAAEAELRKSYYKLSLKVHPDRAPEDPLATEKFQVLGKLYAVLSDKEQRAVYDEQGVVDEESDVLSQDSNWTDYWRQVFPGITMQDIRDFSEKYKGSDEERQDVIEMYVKHKGNLDDIMLSVMCVSQEDEPRLCSIIQAAIDSGDVEPYPAFTQESEKRKRARRKRADRERQEAEEMQKKLGFTDEEDSLKMMFKKSHKSREQNFNSLLSNLEAKYCKKGSTSKSGKKGKKK